MKILFGLSGSIACFKACAAISALVKEGFEVQVAATNSALEFIGEATLEGLTSRPVFKNVFERGQMMDHIHLSRWADVLVICPASANTVNSLAHGLAQDVLGTLFLAHEWEKPVAMFPAMNSKMLEHPATQESIRKLTQMGVVVYGTGDGNLACGEEGLGRLLESEQIVQELKTLLAKNKPLTGKRILVTAGGTREPLDTVRFISNGSSGRTGLMLAQTFAEKGAEVTLLTSQDGDLSSFKGKKVSFHSYLDLAVSLRAELADRRYDTVVHCAAVSDFAVEKIESAEGTITPTGKIDSQNNLLVHLRPTDKLVDHLKSWSLNKNILSVGFKLTSTGDENERVAAVQKLFSHGEVDYVVHNDISEVSDKIHRTQIFARRLKTQVRLQSKKELAEHLTEIIANYKTAVFPREVSHDLVP